MVHVRLQTRISLRTATRLPSRHCRQQVFQAVPLAWPDISVTAGLDVLDGFHVNSSGSKPSTSPTAVVVAQNAQTWTDKPVLLYRDTNAWCPYCQVVWMALLEKKIPFDTVLIDLGNKPDWYTQVASNNKTPAVKFGNKAMCESLDILFELEKRFPEIPLLPGDAAKQDAVREFIKTWSTEYPPKLFKPVMMKFTKPGAAADAAVKEVAASVWEYLDSFLQSSGGPFLFGDISLADIVIANGVMRFRSADSSWSSTMPPFPRLVAWFEAISSRPSWKATCVDDGTYALVLKRLGSQLRPGLADEVKEDEVDMSHVTREEMDARREAAAKIAVNRKRIAEKLVDDSGVLRGVGSTLGPGYSNVNGYMIPTRRWAFLDEAYDALQRVCTALLTDQVCATPSREAAAVQVAMLAYFANLASAPRDLSAAAVGQLRASCYTVIGSLYAPHDS